MEEVTENRVNITSHCLLLVCLLLETLSVIHNTPSPPLLLSSLADSQSESAGHHGDDVDDGDEDVGGTP